MKIPILDITGVRFITRYEAWDFILHYGLKSYRQARKWGKRFTGGLMNKEVKECEFYKALQQFTIDDNYFTDKETDWCNAYKRKCEDNPNCPFKQLIKSQQEVEELKDKLYNRGTSPLYSIIIDKLQYNLKEAEEALGEIADLQCPNDKCKYEDPIACNPFGCIKHLEDIAQQALNKLKGGEE